MVDSSGAEPNTGALIVLCQMVTLTCISVNRKKNGVLNVREGKLVVEISWGHPNSAMLPRPGVLYQACWVDLDWHADAPLLA